MAKQECKRCKSVYELWDTHFAQRDKDSIRCEVCGEELISWNGSHGYNATLLVRHELPGPGRLHAGRVNEKMREAARRLALGDEPLRDRLSRAFNQASMLHLDDFPPDLREDYAALHDALTAVPGHRGEGAIAASVAALSDDDVRWWAGNLFGLAVAVIEYAAAHRGS